MPLILSNTQYQNILNWFLNLLDRNVIEREIKMEKVQMKSPIVEETPPELTI